MNEFSFAALELDASLQLTEDSSLTFVNDAEYEFVGGGAAIANGY